MKKNVTYGETAPQEGTDVRNTNMLKPGAREPASHQTGSNDQSRHTNKSKPFGKLGGRSFGGN